ncbi:MAG: metallophosphoesterase family protein [Clostridiales bacterium]|nr:metallophosphoesterase family protein [Clostridiales bacterium]
MRKYRHVLSLSLCILILVSLFSSLASANTFTAFEDWAADYDTYKNDSRQIALSPGSDESEMGFAWLSSPLDLNPAFKYSSDKNLKNAKRAEVATSLTPIGQLSNKVNLKGLKKGSVYYYSYTIEGVWSEAYSFKTGAGDNFKALLVADSQIGRSGDERDDEVLCRDSFGWNNTLEVALGSFPDTDFILSAGDQVESAYSNDQYNLFFAPATLRSIPVAAALGNHDFYFPLYKYRFNNPNEFEGELIESPAGSGFWFTRGQALFIVIDSNIPFPLRQEKLIEDAVKANPNALWRIVMMHHSIYGAYGGEARTDNLWRFYAPIFDRTEIDLVLSGHDHAHCRTLPIKGGKVVDYGQGTVYLSANSSSGSKFGREPAETPWYAAGCTQPKAACFSLLGFEEGKITINSYRADSMERIDEELVLEKTAPSPELKQLTPFERFLESIFTFLMVMKASIKV